VVGFAPPLRTIPSGPAGGRWWRAGGGLRRPGPGAR